MSSIYGYNPKVEKDHYFESNCRRGYINKVRFVNDDKNLKGIRIYCSDNRDYFGGDPTFKQKAIDQQ